MADLLAPGNPVPAPLVSARPLERLRAIAVQPAVQRAIPLLLVLAALGGAGLAWTLLAPAPQRVLYSQLDDAQKAAVASALDQAGIGYAIDNATGALSVDEGDLYRARMLVAADGALAAPDAGAALDTLPLGASRALEGERLRAAREHELMLTIQQIDGVEAVRVHLAEASRSVFVREDAPPSASVMVRMARGRQLGDSQVAAIVNLVAGSVPGLSPDAVQVADQHGRLLSQGGTGSDDRLDRQARLEAKLRNQLDGLLTPMLGQGQFTSEIQVELDMDEVTSARESYDKDGVLRSETSAQSQQSGGSPGPAGGVPGVLSNTPPPAATLKAGPPQGGPPVSAPSTPSANGESSATRTYELGREVAVANSSPGRLKRLSVAVAIAQGAMKPGKTADIEQVRQLVSAAVGADPRRGDQVTVVVRPFRKVEDQGLAFHEAPWFATMVRSLAALIAVVLVLVLAVKPLLKLIRRDPASSGAGPTASRLTHGPGQASGDVALLDRQVGLAQRIASEKPDDAVQALRAMLGQAGGESAR
jgi:flagellar M-ring protein FliF